MADPATPVPATTPPAAPTPVPTAEAANSRVVIVTAIASFVIIFSLVASKTLFSRAQYQNRVENAKRLTLTTIKSDITASNTLTNAYDTFDSSTTNIIGGSSTGTGVSDGANSKIVLDALPSSYDFPALTTSIEKMIGDRGLQILTIAGIDDQLTQQTNIASTTPSPVAMPFSLSAKGDYASLQSFVTDLQNSIRPFQIQTITASGAQDGMTLTITAQTYYQPAKELNITTKAVE
jgi:hypothetical protein